MHRDWKQNLQELKIQHKIILPLYRSRAPENHGCVQPSNKGVRIKKKKSNPGPKLHKVGKDLKAQYGFLPVPIFISFLKI